jgi:formate hydrogenlyase subunit 6/NADH:ubiquinone oxidoreductase subunit I
MQTGPKATAHFDLALTEVLAADRHYFVVEVGSKKGGEVLEKIPHQPLTAAEKEQAESLVKAASQRMGRTLQTADLKELLYRNVENPQWEEVAKRCLACANCTMVCPTCFCATVEDVTSLDGSSAERWRKWDSCFTMEFSYIHGGSVRYTPKARYRQWITHKLASWVDQFGTFGCVGCGRCLTWCPVGIDITAEAQALRDSEAARAPENAAVEKV